MIKCDELSLSSTLDWPNMKTRGPRTCVAALNVESVAVTNAHGDPVAAGDLRGRCQ